MVETARVENAPVVHAEQLKVSKISAHGVQNTIGIKHAANVLFHMKVGETPILWTTTQTEHSTLDFGKLTRSTGLHAVEEALHVELQPTCNALSKSIPLPATALAHGAHTRDVDADLTFNYSYLQISDSIS